MDFNGLVSKLVRMEVESFSRGVGVHLRMVHIMDEIKEWRKDKPSGNSFMMSSGHQDLRDTILDMIEMDTNALVNENTLKSRVTQLAMYANAWVHDREVFLKLEGH